MARIHNLKNDLLSFAAVSSVLMMAATPVASASEDSQINSGKSLQAAVAAELQGIAGTGLQGIAGTGLQGIAGTGLQGIAGTGLQGIAGTGLQGIAGTGLQGIAGTGLQGIAGTGLQGIAGTGLQGIAGTGLQGIAGTGLQGIAGTGLQGIAGTGLQGIAGTGLQGIAGTGLQGIAGTGLQGIAGTGLQGIAGTGLQGIAGTGLHGTQGMPIVAYGPVEEILDNGYVVLGQFVATLDEAALLTLSVGDVVVVFGLVSEHGLVSDQIVKLQENSIDGSSIVFVAGIVDAVNTAVGELTIGELTVRIGSAGANPETFQIQSGQYVEVLGLRFGRVMVAQAIEAGPTVL